MTDWQKLLNKQQRERRDYLRQLAAKDMSMSVGARMLGVTPSGLAGILDRHGVEWARHTGRMGDMSRKRYSPDDYRKCALDGMSKSETATHLGVAYNAVVQMEQRYEIKFADGRARNRPNQGKGIS